MGAIYFKFCQATIIDIANSGIPNPINNKQEGKNVYLLMETTEQQPRLFVL